MKYLVTLKPIGSYFFGGEVTLGEGTSQNYFVESNLLPQTSALLGLMRYEVLRQNTLLSYDPSNSDDKNRVDKLIGDSGFNLEKPKDKYGIIRNISPVFLTDNQKFYTAMPLDAGYPVQFSTKNRCSYFSCDDEVDVKKNCHDDCCFSNFSCYDEVVAKKIVITNETVINGFDCKTYDNYKYWCDPDGNRFENPFSFSQQIGITKNERNENGSDAFYKQTLIRLNPSLSFAFTVEVDDDSPLKEVKTIIPLGGNRSMFFMNISSTALDMATVFSPLHQDGRILALGDAFLNKADLVKCTFIWGENKPCRYMVNSTDKKHSWKKPQKTTVLYHLLSRGSVIYADSSVLNDLQTASALNNLGLNIFI